MVRSLKPIRAARRTTELREKLGAEQTACIYCGCTELAVLRRVPRKLLEQNHLFGRNHDSELTVYVCRNCHALYHERLLNAGVDLRSEPDPVKRVATMLRTLAVHFEMLAASARQMAAWLDDEQR